MLQVINPKNKVELVGTLGTTTSYISWGETFYDTTLGVRRSSGTIDFLPLTISAKLLNRPEDLEEGRTVSVRGQVRNYKLDDKRKMTVFAQEVHLGIASVTTNEVRLEGCICRKPIYRITPFGREICDIMLRVYGEYDKTAYIPCIAWGRDAQYAGRLDEGTIMKVVGRFQSRLYDKVTATGEVIEKTALEVSIFTLEIVEE